MAAFTSPTLAVPMLESVLMGLGDFGLIRLDSSYSLFDFFGILLCPAVVVFFKASPFFS